MSARVTPADSGCWVAGHHGHYASAIVIETALNYGWHDTQAAEIAARYPELTEHEQDVLNDVVNDAEQWLNEHIAPEGYSFGWHDGEFFLWTTEEWEMEA
jgi:hypothetical protein